MSTNPDPGQPTGPSLAKEAVSELTGLERRFPRTLLMLLARPGFLTEEIRSARGALYVSPVRFYLVLSTVYFGLAVVTTPRGLNLGLFAIQDTSGELPLLAPALFLLLVAPTYGLLLYGLFGSVAPKANLGEFLAFALYFQSFLLLVSLLFELSPARIPHRTNISLAVLAVYLAVAAHRLWCASWWSSVARALGGTVLYMAALIPAIALDAVLRRVL